MGDDLAWDTGLRNNRRMESCEQKGMHTFIVASTIDGLSPWLQIWRQKLDQKFTENK